MNPDEVTLPNKYDTFYFLAKTCIVAIGTWTFLRLKQKYTK